MQPDWCSQFSLEKQELIGELLAAYAALAGARANIEKALAYYEIAKGLLAPANWLQPIQHLGIGLAYYYNGKIDKALKFHQKVLEIANLTNDMSSYLTALSQFATLHARSGQLHTALEKYLELITEYNRTGRVYDLDNSYIAIAALYYEWNDLAQSLLYAEKAYAYPKYSGNEATVIEMNVRFARIYEVRGLSEKAKVYWEKLEALPMEAAALGLALRSILGQRALVDLHKRDLTAAYGWLDKSGLSIEASDTELYKRNVEYMALSSILISQQKYQEVDAFLERLLPLAQAGGFVTRQIQIYTLQAISFFHQQKKAKAFAALLKAIELGQPEGYIRSLLDRGFSIETVLTEFLDSSVWKRRQQKLSETTREAYANYVNKLLAGARTDFPASSASLL